MARQDNDGDEPLESPACLRRSAASRPSPAARPGRVADLWPARWPALWRPWPAHSRSLACGTGHPGAIAPQELAEAQTFPFFKVYWVGPSFEGHHLTAADGRRNYLEKVGDSVYYGDCVKSKGIFGGGAACCHSRSQP